MGAFLGMLLKGAKMAGAGAMGGAPGMKSLARNPQAGLKPIMQSSLYGQQLNGQPNSPMSVLYRRRAPQDSFEAF